MLPIETWSSCPNEVGTLSAEGGKHNDLFSVKGKSHSVKFTHGTDIYNGNSAKKTDDRKKNKARFNRFRQMRRSVIETPDLFNVLRRLAVA